MSAQHDHATGHGDGERRAAEEPGTGPAGHGAGDSGHGSSGHGHGHGHASARAEHRTVATIPELIAAARANLPDKAWDYVVGGAESETTLRRNRAALDALALRSRVLADVAHVATEGHLLGRSLRIPVVLSPIGSLDLVAAEGVAASAAAAGTYGTIAFVSSGGTIPLADLADHAGHVVWQVYGRGRRDWLLEQAELARSFGCLGICLTADVPWYGRRERDLRRAYIPPGGGLHRAGRGHPITWGDVEALVARGDLPVILKGVTTVEDATAAVEHGVRVVYVSNHGGRQLDQGEATVDVLAPIVDAVAGRAEVVMDGGILRGTDVVKALARGANAVAIGKLQALSLAAGGAPALVNALEILEDEIHTALGLMGASAPSQLSPANLRSAPVVTGLPHPIEALLG
jgi:isopentenyl diphosphate isomerase/L-lactate dehydrogenase-like FMN-dependent dehydrogenase